MSASLHLSEVEMPAQGGRIPSLDGLRAVSVLIVLASHFISSRIFPGSLGVYVFFVISGFLITRLLLAEADRDGHISLPRFYARRALRLYPVVIAYTIAVIVGFMLAGLAIDWRQPIAALFYFANYLFSTLPRTGGGPSMPFEPLWSLSVEEHFYILLPAVVVLLRKNPRGLLAAMVGVCVACLAYRFGMATAHPELLETNYFYMRTECRLDSLAFGVALAAACQLPEARAWIARLASPALLVVAGALVLFTLVYRDPFFRETFRYSLQGLGIMLAVIAILFRAGWIPWILNTAPAVFIGQISYSLYVWSIGVPDLVTHFADVKGPVASVAFFAAAFGLACASYFLLEKPLMGLRHRLAKPTPVAGREPASGLADVKPPA